MSSTTTEQNIAPRDDVPDQIVGLLDPMPHRYIFVPAGNQRVAAACRERTREVGRAVYSVLDDRGEVIGLRVPHYILEPVIVEQAGMEEVKRRVGKVFPRMPARTREAFLAWFEAGGRVRRVGSERDVVMREVFAFVRRYEGGGLVRDGNVWRRTRRSRSVEEIVREWGFVRTRRHRGAVCRTMGVPDCS